MFTATDMSEKHVVTFVSFPNLRTPGGSVSFLSPQWVPLEPWPRGRIECVCPWGVGEVALPLRDNKNCPL